MKVKQEIIEATYSIEELTIKEFSILKDGLREIIRADYHKRLGTTPEGAIASNLLDKLEGAK